MSNDDAAKAVSAMKNASETVRSAIAAAIPVASNQILTVAVPGTMINWKDFHYNADETIKAPLAVRVAEARLVDGMIPLSKFTSGKTGKSVARSYLSTLDLMVPVEASVSGVIGSDPGNVTDQRLLVVKNRYEKAMEYLKSADDTPGANGRSKLSTYVMKQEAWSREVEKYSSAQNQALASVKPPAGADTKQIKEARELYMQWIQEHGRDYKHNIQSKYMDWVVHGYKFMIDFNFGIVDISSGMKRIENSKEAFRNLTLIADDGVSEYSSVVLTPSNWAEIIKKKVLNWESKNDKPSPSEIRAEIRRLKNLLASHQVLKNGIETDNFFPVVSGGAGTSDAPLKKAYADVYADAETKNRDSATGGVSAREGTTPEQDSGKLQRWKNKDWASADPNAEGAPSTSSDPTGIVGAIAAVNPLKQLEKANTDWADASLKRNNNTVRTNGARAMETAKGWLTSRITQIENDIKDLEEQLGKTRGPPMPLPVIKQDGTAVTDEESHADPVLLGRPAPVEADPWTRVSCKASRTSQEQQNETSSSASAVAFKAGWGLFSAEGGASHTQSSAKAMSSMSNLEVEIKMDCMVVEIDRPWLHGELFADAELDSGAFKVSPGETALKKFYDDGTTPPGYYQQFSSYPTAMVVAADIELSFSGDTTHLESAVEASSTEANVKVGYGPFSVSASHKQEKSSSKTKMESTATGCKISVQAPQIVGWVQTLIPQLPKPVGGESAMVGLFDH